ncbi:MAG: ABC transporter substrate-binding protein [Sphingorhabdus sp.]
MTTRFLFLTILALLLAACSGGVDNSRLRVDIVSADEGYNVGKLPLNMQSAYLRAATARGLVSFDPQGRVVPALASRWMVAEDGLSYIFRLQKARWNNGIEVEASDVAKQLNSQIAEMRKRRFGSGLDNIIRVERMTGRVIQFRLHAPMPNLLEFLAQPEFGIVHKDNGSGPMMARSQGSSMMLRLREEESIDEIILSEKRLYLYHNGAGTALARLRSGDSDIVTGGRLAQLPLLYAADLQDAAIDYGSSLGQFGLLLVEAGPFLSEPTNREAIAMGIDRPRMLTAFEGANWRERISLVQENIQDRGNVPRPGWASLNMAERKTRARAIISGWKAGNGTIRPLRIAMPAGPGHRILFAWLRADLTAIGLEVKKVAIDADADFRLIDQLADSSSAAWYLDQLSCKRTVICDKDADALVTDGRAAFSSAERSKLFGEAETLLQKKRNFIPIANPLRWTAYREGLLGYLPSPRGWHYLQYLGRDTT